MRWDTSAEAALSRRTATPGRRSEATLTTTEKRALFDQLRASQAAAGVNCSVQDGLVCPLCWRPACFDEFTWEHIVPGAVGGHVGTLTCRRCNSEQGSRLDASLKGYLDSIEAFQGSAAVRGRLRIAGHDAAVNVAWGQSPRKLDLVAQASHPNSPGKIKEALEQGHREFTLDLSFRYNPIRFQVGLLRAAYLALFQQFGYHYAKTEFAQRVRRRVSEGDFSQSGIEDGLVGQVTHFQAPVDEPCLIVEGVLNELEIFSVVIRLRGELQVHYFVLLPVPSCAIDNFLRTVRELSRSRARVRAGNRDAVSDT